MQNERYILLVSLVFLQLVSLSVKGMKGQTGMYDAASLNLFLGRQEPYEFSTNTHLAFRRVKRSELRPTTA